MICRHMILLTALLLAQGAAAQDRSRPKEKTGGELEVHNTIALPPAAHRAGGTAGVFVDPITGKKVYRLSDRTLCPKGGLHFYSYTNQFSPKGRMVFDCSGPNAVLNPIYDQNFRMLWLNAETAARYVNQYGNPQPLKTVQWSQEREVLYGVADLKIIELDPFAGKNRVFADFSAIKEVVRSSDGAHITISTAKDLSVGPGDRVMVLLQCRRTDAGCPQDWGVVGIGVFDPVTGKYTAMYFPVPGDRAPYGFDRGQWSQNPKGRLVVEYNNAPNFSYTADLSSRVQIDDNHGHRGYFCGSNGRCYMVRTKNDTLRNGSLGEIGCRKPNGETELPWRTETAIYDDETGKRVLIWGCDLPGQNPFGHFARSPGAKDVFGVSTDRFTFDPSLAKFYPTDEAILRAEVEYAGGNPVGVRVTPVAYHRSASSDRAKRMGRQCGYWANPRLVMDFTGTRFMFDSTMSHPEWPSTDDGQSKLDCVTDVYVTSSAEK